ncbi:alkaline phosphatase family protein [Fusobacterium varium]|jgi:predicted AlkP superfamily pyrophosphatase or phosphodiesterase|uniref:Nucleotide pyrophosphatase n=1 Tax=Fusobacterium varium ATCC 27725 TaxID=469618 RepID=A0ABM6U4E0_FUSVA|nr:alkaline phosphatase family protein [Fusobacterium varium]AVQ31196.1 nucleotide pyrophosphatase [Fusobacterium varium ATCC 27725]EES62512.1 type I phosphodiesterase / nucleotide pyrophosphatase [Fusobacterium varium ATCC 27725]VEH40108.1 phosphoglyceromutase [Fusobacterium varium]
MEKVILVIIDGLSYGTKKYMGFLEALKSENLTDSYKVQSGYPSLSRPLYEEILTGVSPVNSGIVNNEIKRLSKEESVFSLAVKNGKKTAAAAYYWVNELYNTGGFDRIRDSETENEMANINYGRFYWEDNFPDTHLFVQGEILRKKYNPDILLIHSMNVDDIGHKFGGTSSEYIDSARKISDILSALVPNWIKEGYQIIITSDHGMSKLGNHGGISPDETLVPMWLIGDKIRKRKLKKDMQGKISQKIIAPLCCEMMNIKKSQRMVDIEYEETTEK